MGNRFLPQRKELVAFATIIDFICEQIRFNKKF